MNLSTDRIYIITSFTNVLTPFFLFKRSGVDIRLTSCNFSNWKPNYQKYPIIFIKLCLAVDNLEKTCRCEQKVFPIIPSSLQLEKQAMMFGPYADVMARYRSSPAVSQIWALMIKPLSSTVRVLNSTPMVVRLSWLNSFLVKRDSRLLFPTPDSPIKTTGRGRQKKKSCLVIEPELPLQNQKPWRSTDAEEPHLKIMESNLKLVPCPTHLPQPHFMFVSV